MAKFSLATYWCSWGCIHTYCTFKWFFSLHAVNKAAINDRECPPVKYTAYAFYINTERNTWKMHFNVTKALDALIQVRLYAPGLLYCLHANFSCSKSRRSMMLMTWRLSFSFNFVIMESLWISRSSAQIRGGASYQLCTHARCSYV